MTLKPSRERLSRRRNSTCFEKSKLQPPTTPETIPLIAPYIIGGVFTLLGAALGGGISLLTTARNSETQKAIQQAEFARDARSVRLSTIAAVKDLVQYARAAAEQAHYN